MEAWASEFVSVWQASNTRLAELVVAAIEQNPSITQKYQVTDFEQIMLGALAMIREELSGSSRDARDAYMQTVFPGLLAQGEPLAAIVNQVTLNAVIVYNELIPRISKENRDRAGQFLMWWYAAFNGEIVTVGLEVLRGA